MQVVEHDDLRVGSLMTGKKGDGIKLQVYCTSTL